MLRAGARPNIIRGRAREWPSANVLHFFPRSVSLAFFHGRSHNDRGEAKKKRERKAKKVGTADDRPAAGSVTPLRNVYPSGFLCLLAAANAPELKKTLFPNEQHALLFIHPKVSSANVTGEIARREANLPNTSENYSRT